MRVCNGEFQVFPEEMGASQVALVVKNPPANVGDIKDSGSIPGLGRSPGLCIGGAELGGSVLRAFLDQIAERDHAYIGKIVEGGHVFAVGDAAAADNAYVNDSVHSENLLTDTFFA